MPSKAPMTMPAIVPGLGFVFFETGSAEGVGVPPPAEVAVLVVEGVVEVLSVVLVADWGGEVLEVRADVVVWSRFDIPMTVCTRPGFTWNAPLEHEQEESLAQQNLSLPQAFSAPSSTPSD